MRVPGVTDRRATGAQRLGEPIAVLVVGVAVGAVPEQPIVRAGAPAALRRRDGRGRGDPVAVLVEGIGLVGRDGSPGLPSAAVVCGAGGLIAGVVAEGRAAVHGARARRDVAGGVVLERVARRNEGRRIDVVERTVSQARQSPGSIVDVSAAGDGRGRGVVVDIAVDGVQAAVVIVAQVYPLVDRATHRLFHLREVRKRVVGAADRAAGIVAGDGSLARGRVVPGRIVTGVEGHQGRGNERGRIRQGVGQQARVSWIELSSKSNHRNDPFLNQ